MDKIKSFCKDRKSIIIMGVAIILINFITAISANKYLKPSFYIFDAYLILLFASELKGATRARRKADIKALFLYSSLMYIIELLGMELIVKMNKSIFVEQSTLSHAKITPILLFVLVLAGTWINMISPKGKKKES